MSRNIKLMKRIRATALVLGIATLWILLPFYFQADWSVSRAEVNPPPITPALRAQLSGSPIASVTPTGMATYTTNPAPGNSTTRTLLVDVNSVNLSPNTVLTVFLNDANIGQITLDAQRRGNLRLSTMNNGTVPTVVSGNSLTVRNGDAVVLNGTFSVPATPTPPTPNPTPSGTPVAPVRLHAPLTGEPIGDIMPRGFASFDTHPNNTRHLEIFANFVNLPNGTVLTVFIGDTTVGEITLNNKQGRLRIESNVPAVVAGNTVSVKNGETTILSGTFTNTMPTPPGSPMPTPSPMPARHFKAKLRGSNVVPAVTTNARGDGMVRLNPSETKITVDLHFDGLSGQATAATINGPALPGANADVIFTLTIPNGTNGHIHMQEFDITPDQLQQIRAGLWYIVVSTANNPTGEIRGQIGTRNVPNDFQGDGFADVAVLRPGNNTWYILNTFDLTVASHVFGQAGDVNVQGDYDGDGIADLAMFTPSTGNWQIRRSGLGTTVNYRFGQNGDIPVIGDYDGDGRNDLAIFRPSTGAWYIQNSLDGRITALAWGINGDRPISGDFDGDGLNDIAVFRPSNGGWYIFQSVTRSMLAMQFGQNGDRPISGDFDGDGRADIAVFRPSNGAWYINQSSNGVFRAAAFGMSSDVPVASDYDGDGISDIAVYRPSNGFWYILQSSNNALSAYQFGVSSDTPSQIAYTP